VEEFDLAGLVRQVAEVSRPLASNKQQSLRIAGPVSLLIEGDYDRLWEALDNLVNNAIKYTPPGGDIDIVVKPNTQEALIEVRDSGLGLSPQDLSRLFGRFARLSAQPTGGESSTGLGLSIVKKIVDLHGGSVHAESPGPQRGSTFTVSLPLERSPSLA
jgi:signal transduction histidine kinase